MFQGMFPSLTSLPRSHRLGMVVLPVSQAIVPIQTYVWIATEPTSTGKARQALSRRSCGRMGVLMLRRHQRVREVRTENINDPMERQWAYLYAYIGLRATLEVIESGLAMTSSSPYRRLCSLCPVHSNSLTPSRGPMPWTGADRRPQTARF